MKMGDLNKMSSSGRHERYAISDGTNSPSPFANEITANNTRFTVSSGLWKYVYRFIHAWFRSVSSRLS